MRKPANQYTSPGQASVPAVSVGDGMARVAEGARYLALSRSKIYQLMDLGEIGYAKFGASRRIPWKSLFEYAERSLIGGTNK